MVKERLFLLIYYIAIVLSTFALSGCLHGQEYLDHYIPRLEVNPMVNKPLTEIDILIIKYFKQGVKGRPLAEQLTRELGRPINKNVVCGKVHRLKQKGYLKPTPPTARTCINHRPRKAKRVKGTLVPIKPTTTRYKPHSCYREKPMPEPTVQPPPSKQLTLMELTRYTCRFPSKTTPYSFCGHRVTKGQYCTAHTQLCYTGKPIRRTNQHRIRTIG